MEALGGEWDRKTLAMFESLLLDEMILEPILNTQKKSAKYFSILYVYTSKITPLWNKADKNHCNRVASIQILPKMANYCDKKYYV